MGQSTWESHTRQSAAHGLLLFQEHIVSLLSFSFFWFSVHGGVFDFLEYQLYIKEEGKKKKLRRISTY